MMFRKKRTNDMPVVLPRHIAVIMDGNGRWATKRGLPRTAGHSAGAKVFENICRYANKLGVEAMTFYAFSTENWKRPTQEVDTLMRIFTDYLGRIEQFKDENMRLCFSGDRSALTPELQRLMKHAEENSAQYTGLTVNIAVNYGGRDELLHAAAALAKEGKDPDSWKEEDISANLYTHPLPDVDLLIRPGGEMRISNFLLWQSAYAELYFCDTLWPDFKPSDLDRAIAWYSGRNRRFGGIKS